MKDPNAPKKPLSGYMLWMKEEARPLILKENPSMKTTDVAKEAGALWRAKSDKEKAEWKR